MAKAEFHEVMEVDRDKLWKVITNFSDYPRFVDGVKSIKVEPISPGKSRVSYEVSMMKEVHYTIDLQDDKEAGVVQWTLVSSDSFKVNNGRWELKTVSPGKTDVKYMLEVEFNFPVPGMILNRLVKGTLPSMVAGFIKRTKTHG